MQYSLVKHFSLRENLCKEVPLVPLHPACLKQLQNNKKPKEKVYHVSPNSTGIHQNTPACLYYCSIALSSLPTTPVNTVLIFSLDDRRGTAINAYEFLLLQNISEQFSLQYERKVYAFLPKYFGSKTKQYERVSYYLAHPYLPATSTESIFPAEDSVPLMFSVISISTSLFLNLKIIKTNVSTLILELLLQIHIL